MLGVAPPKPVDVDVDFGVSGAELLLPMPMLLLLLFLFLRSLSFWNISAFEIGDEQTKRALGRVAAQWLDITKEKAL